MGRCAGTSTWLGLSVLAVLSAVSGYIVPITDTDQLRETCSGMYGGSEAFIEVSFNPSSSGQISLVIYEWTDVSFLGINTPDNSVGGIDRPKTYICTSSAVQSGLCTAAQLGGFITSLPDDKHLNETSIYTTPLKFGSDSFPTTPTEPTEIEGPEDPADETPQTEEGDIGAEDGEDEEDDAAGEGEGEGEGEVEGEGEEREMAAVAADLSTPPWEVNDRRSSHTKGKRQWDLIKGIADGLTGGPQASDENRQEGGDVVYEVPTYTAPIHYKVPKTGYYCVGIVPVTLIDDNKRDIGALEDRQANHAEYSGLVLFRSTFQGELPAVEYPKINFYLALSVIYFAFGCFWAFLCYRHLSELLPMQYYISGTIIFLIIEMLAQFAYYRYINKNGGGAGSIAFLFVIATLNAARNSLSFFLLLIVCMGLSVVTQSLGGVMTRVRILTAFHFVFGVMYSVGTVEVELDNAALLIVLLLIFPLALTLTAFLMWIIVSLNGTILHLQQRKQRYKLQMFQRLWRILIMAVIAIAAFFVVSSLSLSSRLDEDYAPRNWKYRWVLLDGSLATIYLLVFMAVAWLWRPTRDNVRFAMSQELAQDETEADAEDYEIDNLEQGRRRHSDDDADADGYSNIDSDARSLKTIGSLHGGRGEVRDENVVFAMGDDSDEESDDGDKGYKDVERRMRDEDPRRSGSGNDDEDEGEGMLDKRRD